MERKRLRPRTPDGSDGLLKGCVENQEGSSARVEFPPTVDPRESKSEVPDQNLGGRMREVTKSWIMVGYQQITGKAYLLKTLRRVTRGKPERSLAFWSAGPPTSATGSRSEEE